ncbi:MAG: glycosyltransferase family 87 protein [Candidatus Brocadiia bacterium]
MRERPIFPAALIAAILVAQMGVLQLWALACGRSLTYVTPSPAFDYGLDYHDFYQASRAVLAGKSPYAVVRYVTPPLPALVNAPLSLLPFPSALGGVLAAMAVAVLGAYGLAVASFARGDARRAWGLLALGLAAVGLSYPFYFLFERGNIDGFVLALMVLAVWCRGRRAVAAGLFAALAIASKVYPLLLFVPLLIEGRRRAVAAAALALAGCVLVAPMGWAEFARRAVERGALFEWRENGSVACTFAYLGLAAQGLGLPLGVKAWQWAGTVVFLALLLAAACADYVKRGRRDEREATARMLFYFPFMVAVPRQAYHYSLVALLPLIPAVCHLWGRGTDRRRRRALLLVTVGIALSQTQAVALSYLVGHAIPHVLPGVGLLLVLIGVAWYKVRC